MTDFFLLDKEVWAGSYDLSKLEICGPMLLWLLKFPLKT